MPPSYISFLVAFKVGIIRYILSSVYSFMSSVFQCGIKIKFVVVDPFSFYRSIRRFIIIL